VLLLHNTAFSLLPSVSSTSSSNDNDVTQYERNRMELQSLIDEDLAHLAGLEEYKRSCRLQIQELKSMLKEILKKKQKEEEKEKEKEKKDTGPGSVSVQYPSSAVISVFADILLHVRNNLTHTWDPLVEEQRTLYAAVKADYRKVRLRKAIRLSHSFMSHEAQLLSSCHANWISYSSLLFLSIFSLSLFLYLICHRSLPC
jgi:hypothetical protein